MKRLAGIFSLFAVVSMLWSCGPAEVSQVYDIYMTSLYTVNKHTLTEEFSDTSFFVKNMDDFDLETGDRAIIKLHWHYDLYSNIAPEYKILEVKKKIPTYSLTHKDSIDASLYTTAIPNLRYLDLGSSYQRPLWLWNGCQNLNILYKGEEEGAEFALVPRGFKDGFLEFDLLAKAIDAGKKETERLLTFDISNVVEYLDSADKRLLPSEIDKVRTRIYLFDGDSVRSVW